MTLDLFLGKISPMLAAEAYVDSAPRARKGRAKGTPNRTTTYVARFTLADGTHRYVKPARPGESPQDAFVRQAFGSFSLQDGTTPVVEHGIFFSYDAKFVGPNKGTVFAGKRSAFRFDVVVKVAGYVDVLWAPDFDPASLRVVRGATFRLKQLRLRGDEAPKDDVVSTDVDVLAAAAEVRASISRAARGKFSSKRDLLQHLEERPATTLLTVGAATCSANTKRLKDALYAEWLPVVTKLATQTIQGLRKHPALRDGRSSPQAARKLHADLVQEGFLCLFELAQAHQADDDRRRRFDKKAYTHIRWRLRNCALASLGEEVLSDDPFSVDGASPVQTAFDMPADDQVEYRRAATVAVPALRRLASAPAYVMRDVLRAPASPVDDLVKALVGHAPRPLTDEGRAVKRFLELEASLASGYRRLTAIPRAVVED